MFHNLKNYDEHRILQELSKFDFKVKIIPSELEKYMSFSLDNKLLFLDSFECLSSSLYSLLTDLGEIDFGHLSQEFDNEIVDLVKEKGFYPYEFMSSFKRFNCYTSEFFGGSFFLRGEEGQFDPHPFKFPRELM